MLSLSEVGQDSLDAWKADVDLGDYVSITGRVISSKRGELSVYAQSWTLASKALRPLPTLHNELARDPRPAALRRHGRARAARPWSDARRDHPLHPRDPAS